MDCKTFFTGFVSPLFIGVLSTLIGVGTAFFLQWRKEYLEKKNSKISALLETQFLLAAQINTIGSVWKEHLEPLKEEDEMQRGLKLLKVIDYLNIDPLPIKDLSFLLKENGESLLQELWITQTSYHLYVETVKAYEEQKRETMAQAIPMGDINLETRSGEVAFKDMRSPLELSIVTTILIEQAEKSLKSSNDSFKNVRAYIKKNFNNHKALTLAPIEEDKA